MENLPFVSVIIPTHNRLTLLQQTLRCLAQQSYPQEKYEIIVVDNGSEDDTAVYLQKLAQQGQIRFIRQAALGPAVARNVGAEIAYGDIFAFTDDDCLPDTEWLASLAAVYQKYPDVAAVGGVVENVLTDHWLNRYYQIQDERQLHSSTTLLYLDTANASFLNIVFKEIGGFEERFHFPAAEDVEMGYRLTVAGYALRITSHARVLHQGRTSVRDVLIQSWRRGLGQAMLMAEYPQYYFADNTPGWRSVVRQWLDQFVKRTCKIQVGTRPFSCACAVAATLRTLFYLPPQITFLFQTRYPRQLARRRNLISPLTHRWLLLLLIVADNSLRLAGQIAGTFSYTYRQVQQNYEPLPFYQCHSSDS